MSASPRKIRWLIAHEPVKLFLRTAEAFREKLNELTDNAFDVEIYTPRHYIEQAKLYTRNIDFVHRDNGPMVAMDNGEIELSQLHITELGAWHEPNFWALEMPFLFRDHDHAARVFEGPIGKKMLSDLAETSPATGLAFTYSGGFRCIVTDEEIKSIEDIQGLKYAVGINPVVFDTVKALGAEPEGFPIRDFHQKFVVEGYQSDAVETTIPRYLAQFKDTNKKYMTNTKHSLFLTTIVIGTKFLESLSDEHKKAFYEASLYASRLERQWSVEDAEEFAKGGYEELGVSYRDLSDEERDKFKERTKVLYEKYQNYFEAGLIDGIVRS